MARMPRLTIESGPRTGEVVSFDRTIVIGRGSTADVVLEDSTVSRKHALLTWANGECVVSDLQTGNGTFVNNHRVTAATLLADGDAVRLGRVSLRYHRGAAAASAPAPEKVSVALVDAEASAAPIMLTVDAKASASQQLRKAVDPHKLAASLNRRLEALNEIAADLGQTFEEDALLARVMERLFELLPQAERGMILLQGTGGDLVPKIARTRSGETAQIKASRTLIREVISRKQGVLSVDTQGDQRFREAESLVGLQIRTLVCVPVLAYNDVYGVIQIDSSKAIQPFDEADVALVFAIARQLAMAMANARMHTQLLEQELFHRDLVLARKIQQRFLPRRMPDVPGFSFAVEYTPALAVGGDFYDFLELGEGRIGVAIGDVSGKGVSAALYVAKLGSELRFAAVGETDPSVILGKVNAALATDNDEGMFVTVALVSIDPRSRELTVGNAGHLLPLVREADGRVQPLEGPGNSPLGVREDAVFSQKSYVLDGKDVVVLYTDGVTEATSRTNALFGDDRLLESVRAAGGTPAAVRERVVADVRRFLDGEPQNDDITLVAFGAGS